MTNLHVRQLFPRGGLLPITAWRQRHRAIVGLLWLHVLGFVAYALLGPATLLWHTLPETSIIAVLACLASWPRAGRTSRTLFAAGGLVTCSALLVHVLNGLIEAHFHFFVAVAIVALYEDWLPLLVALGYIVLDHGIVGTLAPGLIYNHADGEANPWLWALIHDGFIFAASAASVVHWRLSEVERERASAEHAARVQAQAGQHAAELELNHRKEIEIALQTQAQILVEQAQLLDLAQDAMFVWELESGEIQFWNRGAEQLYGWTQDEVLGRTPQEILATQFPRPLSELRDSLEKTGRWEGELIHHRRDGSPVEVNSRWALTHGPDGQLASALAINTNITEQKRTRAELEHQARHDGLTGLPNRLTLGRRLEEALALGAAQESPVALLMLDLDRFKDVNDTLGHAWGDRLLCAVGPRLLAHLREGDTLARLGGDEFAVLLPGASLSAAQHVARKLIDVLEQPFDLGDANVNIAASIGIATCPDHGADAVTLLRCADVAMYVAKRGGGGAAVYEAEQDQHSRDRLALAGDLRRAIQEGELVLHYQPKLACTSAEVVGVEALVRWNHPERGLVPPDQFIPVAEQSGLIGQLGRYVLNLAVRDARAWRDIGLSIPVAVNLSMRDMLDPDLPHYVEEVLAKWHMDAACLRVEITESSLMMDPVRSRATLERLCELGVRLSVDDYGTGYSSLRYLQQLPVDELKIDRSFIRHMVANENDLMIVQSTVDLAHGLGLTVVAEGVEDMGIWQRLAAIGCDQAQGYYLCRPVAADALTEWLQASDRLAA
jgi:diguanylate cyclase (GGDEF)-like protein/PAS domain S-box-containing protein